MLHQHADTIYQPIRHKIPEDMVIQKFFIKFYRSIHVSIQYFT